MKGIARLIACVLAGFAVLAGCDNMANQPKQNPYETYSISEAPAQPAPPQGVVARDDSPVPPPPVTEALLRRGQERFDVYCSPCHSRIGDGNGMVVQRGFPRPPSYLIERLRSAPIQHFVDVITHGYGVMYSYAARVDPADRWAIAAYIRVLQASQNQAAALPEEERKRLPP